MIIPVNVSYVTTQVCYSVGHFSACLKFLDKLTNNLSNSTQGVADCTIQLLDDDTILVILTQFARNKNSILTSTQ